jgi:hypothetical protein
VRLSNLVLGCAAGKCWNGGACATASLFHRDDCSSLAFRQQVRQVQHAEGLRRPSFSQGTEAQECPESTAQARRQRCARNRCNSNTGRAGLFPVPKEATLTALIRASYPSSGFLSPVHQLTGGI